MVHPRKAALAVLALAWLLNAPLQAQSGDDGQTRIVTNPKGAIVSLEGRYKLTGQAPYSLVHPISGPYLIRAKMHGYEDYTALYAFRPGVGRKIPIKLSKKTRFKSMIRSLLFPGWGQTYTNQKWKARFLFGLEVLALVHWYNRDEKYNTAVKKFTRAKNAYLANGSDAAVKATLVSAQNLLDGRYDERKRAQMITTGVHLLNVFDALFFFPKYHPTSGVRFSLNVEPSGDMPVLALGMRANF